MPKPLPSIVAPLNSLGRIAPEGLHDLFGERTRPAIARRAAVNLTAPPPPSILWRSNARKGWFLDDLGFVRVCVQAALDWNPRACAGNWRDPIADAVLPDDGRPDRRHSPNVLADLCRAWGLLEASHRARRAGDVILYAISLRSAACGVLIDRREPAEGPDRVALMAPGKSPEILDRHGSAQIPCAVFTWPED